jgi:CRISPR-associated protein Cas5t
MLSGIQPTLEVPQLSTVLGLINAAAGFYIPHQQLTIGYYFEFQQKTTDLETIYMIDSSNSGGPSNTAKSNVIKREFLYDNFLRIYVTDRKIAEYFLKPYYQLVLGRMNDLATVCNGVQTVDLPKIDRAEIIRGQVIPLKGTGVTGTIQALPKYFSNTIPRLNLGTAPYSVIAHYKSVAANVQAYRDTINDEPVDIYLHQLDFTNDNIS